MSVTPGPWRVYRCKWCPPGDACGIKGPSHEDQYQFGVVYCTNYDECTHLMSLDDANLIVKLRNEHAEKS